MDRVRHAVIACAAVAAALLVVPRLAAAQHCHIPDVGGKPAVHEAGWWLRGSTTALAGSADIVGEPRDYEGLGVAVQAGTGRLSGRLYLPAYRVSDAGVGIGDVGVAANADLVPHSAPLRAGVALSLTLPSGNADDGRGMGHVMVAGGPWLRADRGRVRALASVTLASAVGDESQHLAHRHGSTAGWPLVDPMNPREVVTVARAMAVLVPGGLDAGAQITYAAPVMLEGETRVIGSVVAEHNFGRYGLQFMLETPLVGDPFVARALLELSYRFPT